ncbi:lasso peptide biosynthesis B2 protein [Sphingomonas sp. OK281]|uniref:lasso peptide biosynthesis B2 protein n=1 Tax=Sphingomonas sp. OK281 TaxID=1881067 RepID=UPI0008E4FF77|nr:lasso peptide biosynthesis B2 protein [Sphingomonas sp. OK281]SFO41820.1 Transglutaminase-like superfamily protein [Sphingomonas sp. OK281]
MALRSDDLLDSLALADSVHAVRSSDGIIFLDIDRDAYFCVYDPRDATCHNRGPISLEAVRSQLLEQGLVANGQQDGSRASARPITPLWHEAPAADLRSPDARDIARFLRALVCATWRFRRSSFAQMIAHAQRDTARVPQFSPAPATACFERLCLWLPFRIQCLFRSFFLLHFLRCYGLRADWIFGVSLFPFHAHCWLADGDLLLGERIGKVEGFQTIFLIERASA